MSIIQVSSLEMSTDLMYHGMTQNKTFELSNIPDIEHPLLRHFIRGYFDGDGCITNYITNGYKRSNVSFIGTESFIAEVSKIVTESCGLSIEPKVAVSNNGITSSISWGSRNDVSKIRDWFYANSSVFLRRKQEKFFKV